MLISVALGQWQGPGCIVALTLLPPRRRSMARQRDGDGLDSSVGWVGLGSIFVTFSSVGLGKNFV